MLISMKREKCVLCSTILIGLALGLSACARPETGKMVAVAPPPGWEDGLIESRRIRDDYFRSSPETPLPAEDRETFGALAYWPPDPSYYFMGPIQRYANPERFEIVATSGKRRPCERVGWIDLELEGAPLRLQVYRLLDVNAPSDTASLFLPFTDATTGKLTYPAGRYVELAGAEGGPYTLDFNLAHNPSCAYGDPDRFACPITPAENRLDVPIAAGETGYKQPGQS